MAAILPSLSKILELIVRASKFTLHYAQLAFLKGFWFLTLPVRLPKWFLRRVWAGLRGMWACDTPTSYLTTAVLIGTLTGFLLWGVMAIFAFGLEQLMSSDSTSGTRLIMMPDGKSRSGTKSEPAFDGKPFDKPNRRRDERLQ